MTISPQRICSLLQPLARLFLKSGLKIQDVIPALKQAFILEAEQLLRQSHSERSVVKLSVMTGLQRPDVQKNLLLTVAKKSTSILTNIVGTWLGSPRFQTAAGKPRVLGCEGRNSDFAQLVARVSKELSSYTVLFEMERAGLVVRTQSGLKLISSSHISAKDRDAGFALLGADVSDLTDAVSQNLDSEASRHLHLRMCFDNIAAGNIPRIKEKLFQLGQECMRKAQAYVSKYDLDINPSKKGLHSKIEGRDRKRVVLTIFSFSDE